MKYFCQKQTGICRCTVWYSSVWSYQGQKSTTGCISVFPKTEAKNTRNHFKQLALLCPVWIVRRVLRAAFCVTRLEMGRYANRKHGRTLCDCRSTEQITRPGLAMQGNKHETSGPSLCTQARALCEEYCSRKATHASIKNLLFSKSAHCKIFSLTWN